MGIAPVVRFCYNRRVLIWGIPSITPVTPAYLGISQVIAKRVARPHLALAPRSLRREVFMTHQTALLSTFDAYLETGGDIAAEQLAQQTERHQTLVRFPHSVMLELAFPELDFTNRWCWQRFGPSYGKCFQKHSEYRICTTDFSHCHIGLWTNCWFVKTDYDFGFNEWYFSTAADRDLFLEFVPSISWGENFPK